MTRQILRILATVLLGLTVIACAYGPRQLGFGPLNYDVRDVAVMAGPRIPQPLIAGVEQRVSDAIRVTQRPEPMPRVVLTVKIGEVLKGVGLNRDRNEATFTVDAAAVDNGDVVATGTFKVLSFSLGPDAADQGLAEEIAARIRFAFNLTTPSVIKVRRQGEAGNSVASGGDIARPAGNAAAVEKQTVAGAVGNDPEGGAKAAISLKPAQ